MNQAGYLAIAISILVALGILAISLFLILRKGPHIDRKKCKGCEDVSCPIVQALEERR